MRNSTHAYAQGQNVTSREAVVGDGPNTNAIGIHVPEEQGESGEESRLLLASAGRYSQGRYQAIPHEYSRTEEEALG